MRLRLVVVVINIIVAAGALKEKVSTVYGTLHD